MKTPIPIVTTPSRNSRHSRLLPLVTALTLVCSGATPGPLGEDSEPRKLRAHSEPAAVQSDTSRQLAAKLSSLNGIVRAGVGLFLCGLLSFTYPPLRALVRGTKTRVALLLGGVALMVLPSVIVGNERLLFGAVVLGLGACLLGPKAFRKHAVHRGAMK